MKLPVLDRQGQQVGEFDFDESILGKFVNVKLLHAAIMMYEANLRQGTVKTKNIREVAGKSAKPYKQKGTGRARMGRVRRFGSRGGATAHGPRPRDYSLSMPRTARRQALKSAILGKLRDNEIMILSDLETSTPKTKDIAKTLDNIKAASSRLIVIAEHDENVWKSCRNIPSTDLSVCRDLNAYSVLRRKQVIFTKAALEALAEEVKR